MEKNRKCGFLSALSALLVLHAGTLGHTATGSDAPTISPEMAQAVSSDNAEAVRALLAAGAAPDGKDDLGWTALHLASAGGRTAVAALLLDRGADPNARANFDLTPLHWASLSGHAEVVGLLTRRGARTDSRSVYGMTPLHLAANEKVVEVLAAAGADVNALDARGQTPLHTARKGKVAKALIDHLADLRIRTPQGRTAMEITAEDLTEATGIAWRGPMLARLRGLISQATVSIMNISTKPMDGFVLQGQSPACSVDVTPATLSSLQPGQLVDFTLTFVRSPDAREGEHPLQLSTSVGGAHQTDFELKINNQMDTIPEDSGMIRLAKGKLRQEPSRLHYLAFLAVPLLIVGGWFLLRRRRK
jgi:hypothetical protein